MGIIAVACLIIIALLIFIIIWQYNNYVKPVKEMSLATQKIYEGNHTVRIFIKNKNEAGKLCSLINKINDRYIKLEQNLREKTSELDRTTRSLDNFAYVVSHDLKSPFNSIKSIAELLRLEYEESFDEQGKELLHFIDIKVSEMDRLLMGVLQYSRVRQSEAAMETVDLNQEVDEIISEVTTPPNIAVKVKTPLPEIYMEKDLVHKIFYNLISNAVKSIDKPEGFVEIGIEEKGKKKVFYVKDNGKGIDMKYFDKIFNIFFTIKENLRDDEESSGVGLAIVKKIIEYKGGEIWLESELKKGTTFYFTFPEKQEAAMVA
jgi:light-regulated signal transduction histidine kinase (bacteriophytochrome)